MEPDTSTPDAGPARFALLWLLTLLGAALLFTVEPLVAKLLVPSCGGAFHVWATCLTFFQGVLFLGYLYCLALPRIGRWHLLVLVLPVVALRVTPLGDLAAEPAPEAPTPAIVWALLRDVGLPFFVLSTTSVATQTWLAGSRLPQREDPYRLYSASNLGSLVGLLLYPLVWERLIGLGAQRWAWSAAYGVYVLVALAAFARPLIPAPRAPATEAYAVRFRSRALWFVLSLLPAAFLVSATGRLVEDLGNVPLVWVVPLVIYLGSFVLLFGRRAWVPGWALRLLPVAIPLGLWAFAGSEALTVWTSLGHLVALGAVCLLLHGALHAQRPPSARLGEYWLIVSLGGWVGGALATFAAPLLFDGMWDYPLILLVTLGLLVGLGWRHALGALGRARTLEVAVGLGLWAGACVGLGHALVLEAGAPPVLARLRNVYGVYRVSAANFRVVGNVRTLHHGSTVHGRQLLDQPRVPLGYYNVEGPFGDVFRTTPEAARIGIVGLGVGGLCAYSLPARDLTYYELDPDCEVLARRWFDFLAQAPGPVRVVHGDARLTLGQDADAGRYDLLVIDAFCGDAIPTHLVTREAFALYAEHLTDDGLLAIHVSNRYYDLAPVVADTRPPEFLGLRRRDEVQLSPVREPTEVVVLSRSAERLEALRALGWTPLPAPDGEFLWTDDHADLLGSLRW
ncbi:MAG: fused MFS/spermidine synthase [Planctomycetota bacterium]